MRLKAKDPVLISLIGEFMKVYLPSVRKRDENTIASYRFSISLYLDYLKLTQGVSMITIEASDFNQTNITDFMEWLENSRGNVATTINHRLSDVRSFCKFLMKKKAISPADYEEIREINDVPDERVIEFTWLSVDDMKVILDQVRDNRNALRDRFLLSILYESGARINEILTLRLKDLKPVNGDEVDVHFYGKGNKHRITPLSKEIWRQYTEYCRKYHAENDQNDLLFYTLRNGKKNKMSSDNVSRILSDCERSAVRQLPNLMHLHSHLFRRTRAMHLYQAGVPLPTVSEWLGHSSIETTRFYAKVTEEMKREALHKLSESDGSVFNEDIAFKYAGDEEVLKRLCGLN